MFLDLFLCLLIFLVSFLFAGFPIAGIIALVICSGFETLSIEIFSINTPYYSLSILTFIIGGMIRYLLIGQKPYGAFFYSCVFIALTGFISSLFSLHSFNAYLDALRIAGFVFASFLIGEFIKTHPRFHLVLYVFLIALILSTTYALFQGFNSTHLGEYSKENFYPIAIAMILPILFVDVNQNYPNSWFMPVMYIILFLSGLLAGSRSGTLLLLFVLAGSWIIQPRQRIWLNLLGGLIIALGFMRSIFFLNKLFGETGDTTMVFAALQERLCNIGYALNAFLEHPLLGVGPGQYSAYIQWNYGNLVYKANSSFSSVFIFFAERGFIGILLVAWILVMFFQKAKKPGIRYHQPSIYPALFLSLSSIVFASILYSIHDHLFFWCWIGFLYSLPELFNTNPCINQKKTLH